MGESQNRQVLLKSRPNGMISEENFAMFEGAIPVIEQGQLLIRTKYISLDPAIRGWMNAGTTYIKGIELGAPVRVFVAGEVLESKHDDFTPGTFVSGLFTAQEYLVSDGKGLSKLDASAENLSKHLGILGMPGMTAYFGLLKKGQPKAGDTIYISAAAGIVGSTVGQIARIKGCKVIGSAGTAAKCKYLLDECGFDVAINYKEEDLHKALKKHAKDGVDIYYDNVGGETLDIALANLAKGARVVICGAISQYNKTEMYGPKNYMKIVTARGTMTGIIVFDYLQEYPQAVEEINTWLESGELKTREHIDEGLENFPSTLIKLYSGENFGKLLLKIG